MDRGKFDIGLNDGKSSRAGYPHSLGEPLDSLVSTTEGNTGSQLIWKNSLKIPQARHPEKSPKALITKSQKTSLLGSYIRPPSAEEQPEPGSNPMVLPGTMPTSVQSPVLRVQF